MTASSLTTRTAGARFAELHVALAAAGRELLTTGTSSYPQASLSSADRQAAFRR